MNPFFYIKFVTGTIQFVFDLVKEDQKLHVQLECDLQYIKDELEMIQKDMKNYDRLQLQELVYDIEDFAEGLWVPGGISGPILTVIAMNPGQNNLLRIENFKKKIDSLDKRQKKTTETRPDQSGGDHSSPTAADRSPPTYTPEDQLVGIQDPKAELLELLKAAEGQDSRTKLKVISIVGCHGGGKTALARAVYDHYRGSGEFDCVAWFEASGCKTPDALLRKAPEQALKPTSGPSPTIPINLGTIPVNDRYLVFIDDVHRAIADEWRDSINGAFPENGKSSRIIVTTSARPVARACSSGRYVHMMQCLGESDSKALFWKKVHTNPSKAQNEGLKNIFSKCDGLPLALTSVARHLAIKGDELDREDCEEIDKEFGTHLAADRKEPDAFEELRRALKQCYSDLPDYDHKNCLLSLSIFPRGHQIKSKSFVRRLVAEGLVAGDGRKCLEELIDRCIVEPVKICRNSKVVKRCQVQGVMLESIIERSRLKNFLTLITKEHLSIVDSKVARIRRLSVQSSTKEICDEVARGPDGLSAMRSLTLFNSVPFDFQSCKMLRVLDLEGCEGLDKTFLDGICKSLLLKYLSLRNTGIDELPAEIKKLQRLETLDIRETQVQKLPVEVIMLPRLAYLFGRFELPDVPKDATKLEKFLSEESNLHSLAGFALSNKQGIQNIIISKAKNLKKVTVWDAPRDDPSNPVPAPISRNAPAPASGNSAAPAPASTRHGIKGALFPLGLSGTRSSKKQNNSSRQKPLQSSGPPVDAPQQSNVIVLASSLQGRFAGSYPLESVSIDSSELCKVFLESLEGRGCAIRSIKLRGRLCSFTESNKLSGLLSGLPNLTKLQLISTGLNIEFLSALQNLSGLEYLRLAEDGDEFFKGSFIVEEEGFESLKKLCIEAPKMPKMQFKKGAMESLTSLHLLCPDDHQMEVAAETIEGISNLAILNDVTLHSSATKSVKAWETVADGHPKRPCVKRQAL